MWKRREGPPNTFNPEKAAIGARYFADVVNDLDKTTAGRWRAFQEMMRESGAFPPRRSILSRLFHRK